MSTLFEHVNPEAIDQNKFMTSIVTEAYFGKSKHLLKAEKVLDSICKDIYTEYKHIFDIEGFSDAIEKVFMGNKFKKQITEFENLMMKQFGFGEFQISFFHIPYYENLAYQTPNMFTPLMGIIRHMKSDMLHVKPLAQESGGYYDKTYSYSCTVCVMYEIFDIRPTGGELLGMILHEIGHNFQCTPMTNIGYFTPYLSIYRDIQKAIINHEITKSDEIPYLLKHFAQYAALKIYGSEIFGIITKIYEYLFKTLTTELPQLMQVVNTSSKAVQIFASIATTINPKMYFNTVADLVFTIKHINPIDVFISMTDYSGEVFSDSFAAGSYIK